MVTTLQIQTALKKKGHYGGKLDGITGPKTEQAIAAFKKANRLPATPHLDAKTLQLLGLAPAAPAKPAPAPAPVKPVAPSARLSTPWMNEAAKYLGMHEVTDKKELSEWLRSDGSSVGDPSKLPWCADFVQTAIRLSLPGEPFTGKVKQNPFYALNWLDFGEVTEPCYGAIAAFLRPGGGHVGFLVGYDPVNKRYRLRNGNASNTACDSWIDADRCKGLRWPTTYKGAKQPLPRMNSSGAVVTTNEA
jgi:uncharacterized protein (TIGR02594 family)